MFQVLQDGIIMPVYFTKYKCTLQISYINLLNYEKYQNLLCTLKSIDNHHNNIGVKRESNMICEL